MFLANLEIHLNNRIRHEFNFVLITHFIYIDNYVKVEAEITGRALR